MVTDIQMAKECDVATGAVFINPERFSKVLNEQYGKDGWQLCAMAGDGFVFRREAR